MATTTDLIQQLYVAYYNRPADVRGLEFWVDAYDNKGVSLATISNAFNTATEYTNLFAGKGNESIVNIVYHNLFGRTPDTEGLNFWSKALDNKQVTVADLVKAVAAGALNADGSLNSDGLIFANKVAAAEAFTIEIGTAGNEAERIAYADGTDATKAAAKAYISSVTTDASLATAVAAVHTTAQSIVPGPVVSTTALTTGIDNIVGGAGNDTINAVGSAANGAAFSSLDSIDGGAGTNTLNWVYTGGALTNPVGVTVKNVQIANVTSDNTINADTSTGWTGLTTLNGSGVGGTTLTAGSTTDVVASDATGTVVISGGKSQTATGTGTITLSGSAGSIKATDVDQTTLNISINGGSDVTLTSSDQTTGTITVGNTSKPTGAIVINTEVVGNGVTGGTITVKGGTTVNVNQTNGSANGDTITAMSAVNVTGGASTSAVTVTQAAVATAVATSAAAVAGVAAVAAVTAAPGTQAVAAVTAVSKVAAATAAAGVTADGAVSVVDSKYNTTTANTIKTVTLNNYGAASHIDSNALTTVNLSGTAGTLAINNATNGAGAVPTTNASLALNLDSLSGTNTITDTNAEITTLNVKATGGNSTLAQFVDTGLTTLNISGDKVFKLTSLNTNAGNTTSSITAIAVSGAAGFNDGGAAAGTGFAARGASATLTTTSSGAITAVLDATTQTFVGSTGKDTITINSTTDATKVITGGSGATDELILTGGAFALTSATAAKVTGFETLGVRADVTGTVDMSNLASGITGLHVVANAAGTVAFTKVAANTSLTISAATTSTSYQVVNATGAADSVTINLGGATSDTVNFGTIVLQDANAVGLGTVNLVSNGVDVTTGDSTANNNTVVLTDNGLSNLNVSGTQGIAITTINQTATQATSFTLNNTNSGQFGVVIGTLTDTNLGALNFSGTGSSTITTLTDASSTTLAIGNTGSKLATVGTFTSSANLTSLTLTGNVQIGDGLVGGTGLTATSTAGITVAGATDNAHVKLSLGAAAVGLTNNVVLGNGNNVVTDATIAGTSNVTVGTGSNFLTIGGATTNTTGAFNINLGAHTSTGPDYITVGTGGTNYATAANYVITGAAVGDRIIFNTDSAATLVGHTAGVITATTAGATLALTITALEAAVDALAAHGVAYAVFGGNTYVAESISSTLGGTDTTIVEIVGSHTVTAGTAGVGGYVLITG